MIPTISIRLSTPIYFLQLSLFLIKGLKITYENIPESFDFVDTSVNKSFIFFEQITIKFSESFFVKLIFSMKNKNGHQATSISNEIEIII